METNSKSYSLVAWTEHGRVRMIPSLVNEMCEPYREKIARIETQKYENEISWLIARSKSWEEFARFFLNVGYAKQAYQCFENSAEVCLFGSDSLWIQGDTCYYPTMPLYYRFLSMHGRCKWLIRENPELKFEYEGSELERDYLSITHDQRESSKEFWESIESMKAWHFGHF